MKKHKAEMMTSPKPWQLLFLQKMVLLFQKNKQKEF